MINTVSELRGNLEEDIDLLTYDRDPTVEEMKIAEDIRQAVVYLRKQENKVKKLNLRFPHIVFGVVKSIKSLFEKRKIEQNEWRKTDFHVGDVVQTKEGFDRGLVTKVDENKMPIKVLASPGFNMRTKDYTETSYYGGANSVEWYKTGEHMTPYEWNRIYSMHEGWQRYCEDRSKQAKYNI